LELLSPIGILDLIRTGMVAIPRAKKGSRAREGGE
jgi:acetolactate synthase small subunit